MHDLQQHACKCRMVEQENDRDAIKEDLSSFLAKVDEIGLQFNNISEPATLFRVYLLRVTFPIDLEGIASRRG